MQNKYDYACTGHQGLEKKFYYMFNNNFNPTIVSAVQEQFIQPLKAAYARTRTRQCPAESDWDWLLKGVERVLHNCRSGRDFLQSHQPFWDNPLTVSAYFNKLSSSRRLKMIQNCAQILCRLVDDSRPSPLAIYKELADFDLFAGDGHYLAAPTHEDQRDGTAWATGFFFALNLHTQTLALLALADQAKRKVEQDQHMLKRLSSTDLRMGAPRGRKVLWVWDKACTDLELWDRLRHKGVYFLSRCKTNLCLGVEKTRLIANRPINQGVESDQVVSDRRGIRLREITYRDPNDNKVYVYLTSEMNLEPGMLALLYKTRWDIEKTYDETKTKLQERKAWGTSVTAKQMQAQFMAITHNLLLLVQDLHAAQGVENKAENQRRQKRLEQQEQALALKGETLPVLYRVCARLTQASFKLIRWLRTHWNHSTSLEQALLLLRALYAKL